MRRATQDPRVNLIGCGIYNMQMDKAFIEDVVHRAATLVADHGKEAFAKLRDKTEPFVLWTPTCSLTHPTAPKW